MPAALLPDLPGGQCLRESGRLLPLLIGGSGKEVRSPSPPPLRTVRALFNAYGSSMEQRPCEIRSGPVPLAHDTPYGTRLPQRGNLVVTTSVPATAMGFHGGEGRTSGIRTIPPTDLLCPLRRLAVSSRPSTPEGSQLAFARGHVATPIRPVTGRPSLPPSSFTRSLIGSPHGWPTRWGRLRAYHVASREPAWVRPRLDAGGSSSAPDE